MGENSPIRSLFHDFHVVTWLRTRRTHFGSRLKSTADASFAEAMLIVCVLLISPQQINHDETRWNTMMQTWTWCTQVIENQELQRNYIDFPEQTSSLLCQSFFCLWVAPVIKTRLIPCQICKEHQLLQLRLSGTRVTCRWEPCQAAWTNKRGPLYSTKTRMEIFFEQIQTNWDSGKLANFTNTCALFAVYHEQISDNWFDTIRLRQPLKSHWDFGKPKIW